MEDAGTLDANMNISGIITLIATSICPDGTKLTRKSEACKRRDKLRMARFFFERKKSEELDRKQSRILQSRNSRDESDLDELAVEQS